MMNYLINHTWQELLFNIALIKLLKISDTYRDVKNDIPFLWEKFDIPIFDIPFKNLTSPKMTS